MVELSARASIGGVTVYASYILLADMHAGYIGSASLLKTVVRLVELLRQHNPNLAYGAPIGVTGMGHLLL